jgi:hypothetical protein
MSQATEEPGGHEVLRVLTLDGGGAKGFHTLGVLKEIEAMVAHPLHQKFDLVFGTRSPCLLPAVPVRPDRQPVNNARSCTRNRSTSTVFPRTGPRSQTARRNARTSRIGPPGPPS